MALVLAFGIVLLISVSLSGVAARTVLSTSLLFLVAGAVIGKEGMGIVSIVPDDHIVALLADIALFTVLFTDGQRANVSALKGDWRLYGRALGLGMPLTMVGLACRRTCSSGSTGRALFWSARSCHRPTRSSRRPWSARPTSHCGCGGCSTSSRGSMTGLRCPSC